MYSYQGRIRIGLSEHLCSDHFKIV